jgi:IS5 family transposase
MREVMKRQAELGELSIGSIVLDPKSRDDIPKLLVGLQYIYTHRELRDEVFAILQEVIPRHADGKNASDSAWGDPEWNSGRYWSWASCAWDSMRTTTAYRS